MKSVIAKCPNCGWALPFFGKKFRGSGRRGFDCPDCNKRLIYRSRAGAFAYLGPGSIVVFAVLYNRLDPSWWQFLLTITGLIAFIVFFLRRERIEIREDDDSKAH